MICLFTTIHSHAGALNRLQRSSSGKARPARICRDLRKTEGGVRTLVRFMNGKGLRPQVSLPLSYSRRIVNHQRQVTRAPLAGRSLRFRPDEVARC